MDANGVVFDVTDADFQQRVLERSAEVPVVVDFWAAWCGPCRTFGPQVERAVRARGGDVLLAKVDADANPGLVQAFQVQGIPVLKAIVGGRLAGELLGAQPAPVLEQFLDQLTPSAADKKAATAATLGDPEQAAGRWREVLADDPGNVAARVGLAGLALDSGEPSAALEWLEPVGHAPEAEGPLARARLALAAAEDGSRWAAASRDALDGAPERALADLLAAVREGGEQRERARALMLDVFRVLGGDHPLVARYRRDLTTALF